MMKEGFAARHFEQHAPANSLRASAANPLRDQKTKSSF